jgi:hypothetical protein
MIIQMIKINVILGVVLFTASCNSGGKGDANLYELHAGFGNYWYQGKAEIASYELQQVRYGELRSGTAVMIFVTEDLSRSKLVKLDNPTENLRDALKVMKLNATRKFNTGIYPYSTMTSVFTPVYMNDDPKTVKLTTTSQEWCGHTFLQAILKGNIYKIQGNSYFESEGDQKYNIKSVMTEDELWNRIRLYPGSLPVGNLEILPSSLYCRFKHVPFKPANAVASIVAGAGKTSIYQIELPELKRTVVIEYNTAFPHEIQGWKESYPEGGKMMTTTATLKNVIQTDYWKKNKNEDDHWRGELGLE